MEFKLNKDQVNKLKEWQSAIKKIYGKFGTYEYTFSSDGISQFAYVWSELAQIKLDLTEEENS